MRRVGGVLARWRRLILGATNLVEGASAEAARQGSGGFVCFSKRRGRQTDGTHLTPVVQRIAGETHVIFLPGLASF